MTFDELDLIDPIRRAVAEIGYEAPTPIQQQAIGPALAGRDLLGCAQTGTGKTAAFTLPILQRLAAGGPRSGGRRPIRALVVTPTRELAIQIGDCCRDYARHTALRHAVIFGGVSQRPQVEALRAGVDLLVATPGRLLDLAGQRLLSLDGVEVFVLDEADRMLDMGFIHDIRRILPLLPAARQTLFFSATMPDDIRRLASTMLHDPVEVAVAPPASVVETIRQRILFVEKPEKKETLISLLGDHREESTLVFSRTKHGADRIARYLTRAGIEARAIHGDKSQGARERAMNDFRSGTCKVLVATDIAARGIDISELPLVVNHDLPAEAETYVHRIGRTGRAGCAGRAVSFCSEEERPLLADILKLTGLRLEEDGALTCGAGASGGAACGRGSGAGVFGRSSGSSGAVSGAAGRSARKGAQRGGGPKSGNDGDDGRNAGASAVGAKGAVSKSGDGRGVRWRSVGERGAGSENIGKQSAGPRSLRTRSDAERTGLPQRGDMRTAHADTRVGGVSRRRRHRGGRCHGAKSRD